MEYVAKTDTFFERKLLKAKQKVVSDLKLDEMYPEIFKKVSGTLKPKTETKEDK